MGIFDTFQAAREVSRLRHRLNAAGYELRQTRQALERSERERNHLKARSKEQAQLLGFSKHKVAALQNALREFCPKLSSVDEMKRLYATISPNIDASGFTLYHIAKELTGIDIHTFFPHEDNRGMFETMDDHQLLDCLIAARFDAVEWEIVDGTGYEKAIFREVDTTTPEYQAFEHKLYQAVLERMGFEDILAPDQEVSVIEDKTMELKLYSPLTAEFYMPPEPGSQEYDDGTELLVDLCGEDLTSYKGQILKSIEDEMLPEMEERGLITFFDGSDAVNDKVVSVFPSVEEVDGRLYGVSVCRIKEALAPDELKELKEYCSSQYADGWGEGYAQRPRHTQDGDLYINFWQPDGFFILSKAEMEAVRVPDRYSHQRKRGGDAR